MELPRRVMCSALWFVSLGLHDVSKIILNACALAVLLIYVFAEFDFPFPLCLGEN